MIKALLKWREENLPQSALKRRQFLLLGGGGILLSLIIILLFSVIGGEEGSPSQESKPQKMRYRGVGESLPREEVWVNRMESRADAMSSSQEGLKSELQAMKSQVELLNKALQKMGTSPEVPHPSPSSSSLALPSEGKGEGGPPPLTALRFPGSPQNLSLPSRGEGGLLGRSSLTTPKQGAVIEGKRIGEVSLSMTALPSKSVEGFVPAGTYIQAVVTSGIAASTATNASSNPQPVVLRLVDEGVMPRGWRAALRDVSIIGACYGDLSSERAYCRLETVSYVEPSGEIVEEKIDGWIVGEDGRYGLRGLVVDRADEVARQALISGILGGMASFFQAQSTSSVYPVSPFGQTNAMKPQDMLKGGAAGGVGKALDRLAQFAIDRAEKMSPVILVNPGRVVDVVLKKGLDITKTVYRKTLTSVTLPQRHRWGTRAALSRAQSIEFKGDYQ